MWQSYGKPENCHIHDVMKRTRNAYHYAVRRLKRNAEVIKDENLMKHCLGGNSNNIIKEFKKQNHATQTVVSSIDGHNNNQDIADNFSSIYKHLYQKNDSSELLKAQLEGLNSNINSENYAEVDKITPGIVYQAIESLKSCKNDNFYNFKSDAIIIGKDVLINYLTVLFQTFLVHGFMPHNILTSTLQPIIKDKLSNKCSSSNYRAIGSSSLILKLLDIILITIFEDSFTLAEQQFGFQRRSSTTLCSWAVKETVNYFLNRDTPIFACFLDMTKAFDLVNYSKLFNKLKNRISPVFLRLLAYIYLNQKYCVSWNNCKSSMFNVLNGVRQGAILSPTLFSIYLDELFYILKSSGYGCNINGYFYGSFSYADDIVLLSPSRSGLQHMLNLAKSYFDDLDLIISMNVENPVKSKTKCMAFGRKTDPLPLHIDDTLIPWTDNYTHLGHIMSRDGSSVEDCMQKKRSFIGKYHSLCQLLKQKHPSVYMKLINIYMCDFYGSNLWDLFNQSSEQLYTTWNKTVRYVFQLPLMCHRYFIESMSDSFHLKTKLISRFVKFYTSLLNCNRPSIRNLLTLQENDCRSDFGSNVQQIRPRCRDYQLSNFDKVNFKYMTVNECDKWRVPVLKELMAIKCNNLTIDFSDDDVNDMIFLIACD